jgi:predicted  nucleic acid-binding Zn-ribbon protein
MLDAAVKAAVGQNPGKAGVSPGKPQDGKKDKKDKRKDDWCCPCGFTNFGFRADCKDCGKPKTQDETEGEGGMDVDCNPVKAEPPEKVAKELRNVLSSLTGIKSTNVQGNLMVVELQQRLQAAEDEIRQGKPALVRLQAATRQKEVLLGTSDAATKAVQKTEALLEEQKATKSALLASLEEVEEEISGIQAELGRPQLEAGANAAAACCVDLLQKNGMTADATAQFMEALKVAFGVAPLRPVAAAAAAAPSPFAVKTEQGAAGAAPGTPALSQATGFFTPGGVFPSQGASAFPMGASPEAVEAAASQAAADLEAQQQHWERNRDEGLASLKSRIAVLKHKMGTLKGPLATAREVAKKAQEAGGGIEETKSADELEGEAQRVQEAMEVMEGQRLSLESEAFVKATAQKPARASPF